jgi:glycosyltransferase involved in cell wall biosynthesis
MRLCHVSPHLPPDQAANAILPAQLGEWTVAAGHTVTFVTQEPAQGRPIGTPLAGATRRVPARRSRSRVARLLRLDTWERTRAITSALDAVAHDADLLHLHSNGLIVEVAAAWARRRDIPCILTLYGTEIWHYRPRWPIDPFTRAYRRVRAVTFYSRRLMERARTVGLDRAGLSVIYPAVNDAFVASTPETRVRLREALGIAEPRVVLNVKRLHELAGQRYLIEAFAQVARRRHDVRLVICGTGPLRRDLEDRAEAAGIQHRVTFTGLLANEDVAKYAAVADVFVLPSLLEALPTVAVEALAAGTPVISADHPGGLELHEIFGDDVMVVPRQNVDALAEGLAAAVDQPRRTRAATEVIVRERFGPRAVQSAYMALYAACAGRPA